MLAPSRSYRFGVAVACWLALLLALLALLLTYRPVSAQGPVEPAHTDPYWHAAYWANRDLAGPPLVERDEATLDHDWGEGAPDSRLPSDNFSARWTRYLDVAPGVYRFTVTSDDGIRLFVDDQLVLERWYDHGQQTDVHDVTLAAGHHLLRVDYYEHEGVARAAMTWRPLTESGSGPWRGEYYANRELAGEPAFVHYEERIDFDWREGSPRSGDVGHDNFSARWTRRATFSPGRYRFRLTVDDGARLWVNHHLLVDVWQDQAATTYTADLYVPGGEIPLQLDYYEHEGDAVARLSWARIDEGTDEGEWRGEYYDNTRLRGSPDRVRNDPAINFDWGDGAPVWELDDDYFSVRWTRTLYFDEGRYRFTTETDDGVRLYVDNDLVIDRWQRMARTKFTHTRHLTRGVHTLRMEYFEDIGDAFARLTWKRVDEEDEEETRAVGNIITCVPPQPTSCAWVKVYRLDADNTWIDVSPRGYASCAVSGYLKIDGLLVDVARYGDAGHPYRVEQWVDGRLMQSTGNFQAGEPAFRVRPDADNYTPWQCAP